MKPSPTHALDTLLEQATNERDAAQDALTRARQALEQAQGQLGQLTGFAADYEQRWQQQFKGSTSIEVMRCYQDFMRRLHQATDQQRHAIHMAQLQVDRERERLLARETRVASVRTLMQRRQQEVHQKAQRQDQKANDEAAARVRGVGVLSGPLQGLGRAHAA